MEVTRRKSKAKRIKTEAEFEELITQVIGKFDIASTDADNEKIEQNTQSRENQDEANDSQNTLTTKNRLNLGDNLFLLIGKYGEKTFHYRISLNGKSTTKTIGDYPDVSFEEARKISDERYLEISKLRDANKLSALKAKVKEQKIRSKKVEGPCFARLSDAGKLYSNILSKGIASPEFKAAALLTLLAPTLYEDLIAAKKMDYNPNSNTLTINNSNNHNYGFGFQLPSDLKHIVNGLFFPSLNTEQSPQLFPTLSNMTSKDRDATLVRIFEEEHTQNPISPARLQDFFAFTSEKYGGFNKEFIDKLTIKQNKKPTRSNSPSTLSAQRKNYPLGFYDRQKHAAIHWYAEQMKRGTFAFIETSVSDMV